MYTFPKRVKQHVNESKALAIFLYHVKDLGIVRDIRENDYGIDLEYEYVDGENVIGRIIKIQLKSVSRINKQNPKQYKIKQSTLNYWAELSYRINTVIVAVNTVREEIYFTFPIFWQAIQGIDSTNNLKSINFAKNEGNPYAASIFIHHIALIPTINEILFVHKKTLLEIENIINFCDYSIYSDQFLEFTNFSELLQLLDVCRVLLWRQRIKEKFPNCNHRNSWNTIGFFRDNTADGTLRIWDMKEKLNIIVVELFKELVSLREKVLNSFHYWVVKDIDYYELVYKIDISTFIADDLDSLIKKFASCDGSFIRKNYSDYIIKKMGSN